MPPWAVSEWIDFCQSIEVDGSNLPEFLAELEAAKVAEKRMCAIPNIVSTQFDLDDRE